MGLSAREVKGLKLINVEVEWPVYTAAFNKVQRHDLALVIVQSVLSAGKIDITQLDDKADKTDRASYIRTVTLQLMGRPEYQLM